VLKNADVDVRKKRETLDVICRVIGRLHITLADWLAKVDGLFLGALTDDLRNRKV
jgi:hypothetical protein